MIWLPCRKKCRQQSRRIMKDFQPMQKTALHAKAARHGVRSMFRSWKEWKKQKNCLADYKSGRDKMSDIQLYSIERGTGEPLILLHGNGEESRYFARQIRHFAKTRKVIAIDTRGHGQSPRGNAPFTIRQFAEDLHDFMEEKGIERADILGFSDGGNTALVFALQYPQKVRKLILNGANLYPSGMKTLIVLPIWAGYGAASLLAPVSQK